MTEEWGAILVVDDDAEMRELVYDVCKDRGHQITMAGSGQEALTLLAEQDHAVVLTDLRMKGMPGTELLAEIRLPDIGVILMRGFGSVDNAVEAMKRGASDYLTKPVKTSKDTVRGLIAAHGAHHVLQINLYKKKDYAQLEATWPMMRQHVYLIADTLTTALVKQFPDKFS